MNYYEHHIGDYDKSTSHLTACEDGIYSRLLRRYYDSEMPLPVELAVLQRLVRARTKEEKQAVQAMLLEFFTLADDGWHQFRCDKDIEKFRDKSAKAKRSAESRWNPQCERNANASETHDDRNAHQTPDTRHQQKQEQKPAQRAAARFAEFWSVYPVKKGRVAAEKAWRAKGLDANADEIIAHVCRMQQADGDWERGYIPHGSTYITGERWHDEPKRRTTGPPQQAAPSKTLTAIQRLEGLKHGMADSGTDDRLPKTPLLGFGPDPGDGLD